MKNRETQSWGRRLGIGEGGLQSPGSRTWTQQRVRMFHVNHWWGSWGPTAQSWIWRWWNMFFRLNSLFKIAHLKHFCCQQTETPRITGFKTCPKECNKSRSGHRGSCLGAEIVDLFQVNECQNRDNTASPPTVVNMEQANPLLGQWKKWKIEKNKDKQWEKVQNRKNTENTIKNNET